MRFGYEEFNSFKKVYGDFESIRTKRQLSHTIKDLEVKLTFQQTENDNFTHRVNLMKNEPFVEILSYCVVRIPYILLWESLNKYLPRNCTHVLIKFHIQNMQSLKQVLKKLYGRYAFWNLNHLSKKKNLDCQRNFWN